jgi:hypothetical protein
MKATKAKPARRKADSAPTDSPKCPDCDADCGCGGSKMTDLGTIKTDWYGTLHYWRCKCCRVKFVSQDGGDLETAAIQ